MKSAIIVAALSLFIAFPSAYAGAAEEMLEADRAFAAMAGKEGVAAAFVAYAGQDVRMFPDGGAPYQGRDALIEQFSSWPKGARLDWTPIEAVAAGSGDFGFTWGRYVYSAVGENGQIVEHGKYVSVWRKGPDGAWKVIADIGNSNPAPRN